MNGGEFPNAVVQVLGSKKIQSNVADKERYRMLISDGVNTIAFAMVTTSLNHKFPSEGIPNYSIIRIDKAVTSVINNTGKGETRVLLIMEMDTLALGDEIGGRIGSPTLLTEADMSTPIQTKAPIKTEPTSQNDFTSTRSNGTFNQTGPLLHPIISLSPYQNKWTIKARVTNKSPLRTWSNSKGEGKVFSVDLLDESAEIRLTFFRDLVDKFYDYIQVDKVYHISKCQLKPANKQYSSLKNDYEMTAHSETVIELVDEPGDDLPQIRYNFTPIDGIAEIEPNNTIDVIGVCKDAGETQKLTAKSTGRELVKRDIILVDKTNSCVTVTLWGKEAEDFNGANNPVVVVKGGRVTEFGGGKSISLGGGSQIRINPEIKECYMLRSWYDNGGDSIVPKDLSARTGSSLKADWMTIKEAQEAGLGRSDKGDYYQVAGTILLIRSENAIYQACPTENCNKKLVDNNNGQYRCEKCDKYFNSFKYRILGGLNIGDWSGNQWVSMFNEEMEKVLGDTAQKIGELNDNNKTAFEEIAAKATFEEFIFKCRAKTETYGDEERLKTVVIKADSINYEDRKSVV